MKVKKQKRHRRAVRFFKACYGFREPFKVLCDGSFVHQLLVNKITPADTAVANILGAPVKLYTTSCIIDEMKQVPECASDSIGAARNLLRARCDHEKQEAEACILSVIGENNPEHFFVATQHATLRQKLQKIPGVPVIYLLRNALFLEQPSAYQHQFAAAAEAKRSHMSDLELKLLKLDNKTNAVIAEANVSNGEDTSKARKRKRDEVKDTVLFKRKKAKGPNPLSVKKNPEKIKRRLEAEKRKEAARRNEARNKLDTSIVKKNSNKVAEPPKEKEKKDGDEKKDVKDDAKNDANEKNDTDTSSAKKRKRKRKRASKVNKVAESN